MKQLEAQPQDSTSLQDSESVTQTVMLSQVVSSENPSNTAVTDVVRKYPQGMSIRPRSYWQELAEMGALYDFIQLNMANEFANDLQFRKDMMCVMIDNSSSLPPEIELELLKDLESVLTNYINTVQSCNSNHQ